MYRKIQNGLCLVMVAAIMLVWVFSGGRSVPVTASENISTKIDRQVIVLDAGHGGIDGGCVSVNGACEKDINLSVLKTLRDSLTIIGFDVVCTREDDVSIHDEGIEKLSEQKKSDMKNRLAIFNKYDNAIAISIHQNQFTDPKYSGAQMFYSARNTEGERLAQIMQKQFVSLLQPDNTRETKPVGDELYLLNNTDCPALMIECGFLSNPQEAEKLESADYQKQVAFTILTGAEEYLLSSEKN